MADNTNSESMDHIKEQVSQSFNHIVRHDESTKGIVNIEANNDETFNVSLHDGTQSKARTIEGVSKERLLSMMEEQL